MAHPARILVVDDDDRVRDALVHELSGSYRVEAVACGSEAFDVLASQQFDVVISDLKMPDHDGIEVLEFARTHQRDAVRVLLTGYLDERVHRALMSPDAPYKVGKPWHDEVEVIVHRALEQRDLKRRLSSSIEDALRLAQFDEELAATHTPLELADLVVSRALGIEGVVACAVIARSDDGDLPFSGATVAKDGVGWYLDLAIDDGDLRMCTRGTGEGASQLVAYLAHRAQRRCGVLEARVGSLCHVVTGGERVDLLMRQATIGALTSSLLHDLASMMQSLTAALGDVTNAAESTDPVPGELGVAVAEAGVIGDEIVNLFVQMRKFIRDGQVATRPVNVAKMVRRTAQLVGPRIKDQAELRIGAIPPEVTVAITEALFLQVLANLLRNAASASPAGGFVDLAVRVTDDEVTFTVTDDGPGVPSAIADHMFEPFVTPTIEGTGLGLAISAYIMRLLGGRIAYRRSTTRGACFSVVLPRGAE